MQDQIFFATTCEMNGNFFAAMFYSISSHFMECTYYLEEQGF